MSSSTANNKLATKCGLFGIGLVLGYKFYCKKYDDKPQLRKKTSNVNDIQLNTSNIKLNEKEIDEYFEVALNAAYEAGDIIKKFINDKDSKSTSALTKFNHTDIVTQIDKKCENVILSKIKSSFPNHKIIAEESCTDPTKHNITNDPTWFIDPIDGTTNFYHGIPMVAVCIGLRINKIPILGIVHCPILQETFHAILGRGSYLIQHQINKKIKLQTNSLKIDNDDAIKQALILTEAAYDRSEKWINCINKRFYKLLYEKKVRAIRMLGSCAINMCWIAMGRADIFFEGRNYKSGPKPWDYTAGEIIVYEAGGITCDPEGNKFDCTQGRVLCCNNIQTAKYIINMNLYNKSHR